MHARTIGASLRSTLVAACVVMLLGHVCVPLELPSGTATLASASIAEAPGDAAHEASCEALPSSSLAAPHPVAGTQPIAAFEAPAAEIGGARDAPVPVPRRARFLLFASLLN